MNNFHEYAKTLADQELEFIKKEYARLVRATRDTIQQDTQPNYHAVSQYYEHPFSVERVFTELSRVNRCGLTFVNRAAFNHDHAMIEQLLNQFQLIKQRVKHMPYNDQTVTEQELKKVMDSKDLDDQPAILHACMGSSEDEDSEKRLLTIKVLIENNSNYLNIRSKAKGWTLAHWLCFQGDLASLKYLSEKGVSCHIPDRRGLFPIDIAGRRSFVPIVEYLIRQYKQLKATATSVYTEEQSKAHERETLTNEQLQWYFLSSDLLLYHILYWNLRTEFNDFTLLPEGALFHSDLALPHLQKENLFHACCYRDNIEGLTFLFKHLHTFQFLAYQKKTFASAFTANKLVGNLKALEHSKFLDVEFLRQIAQMVRRQKELLGQIESNYIEDSKLENCVRLLNSWEDGDSRNNTPLHLATMHQSCHCIHHFLSLGADFQRPNFFYWIPPNLANTPSTIAVYKRFFQQLRESALHKKEFYLKTDWLRSKSLVRRKLCCRRKNNPQVYDERYKEKVGPEIEQLSLNMIFNAEDSTFYYLCLEVRVSPSISLQMKMTIMDRNDFLVDIFLQSGYKVALISSTRPDRFYILVYASNAKLAQICKEKQLKRKILNLDICEVFKEQNQNTYEPYTHREAQEIIFADLETKFDLRELKYQGLVSDIVWLKNHGTDSKLKEAFLDNTLMGINVTGLWKYFFVSEAIDYPKLCLFNHLYGIESTLMLALSRYYMFFALLSMIGSIAIQIYESYYRDSLNYAIIFWILANLIWYFVAIALWTKKQWEIIAKLGYLNAACESLDIGDWNDERYRGRVIGESVNMLFLIKVPIIMHQSMAYKVCYLSLVFILLLAAHGGFWVLFELMKSQIRRQTIISESDEGRLEFFLRGVFDALVFFLIKKTWSLVVNDSFSSLDSWRPSRLTNTKNALKVLCSYVHMTLYPAYILLYRRVRFGLSRFNIDDEFRYFLFGAMAVVHVARPLLLLFKMAVAFQARRRDYFGRVAGKHASQEPKVPSNDQFRRAHVDLNPDRISDAVPMPDYVEMDVDSTKGGNLYSNLNWIVLNLVFATSFSFIVPLIHIVVFFNIAFDSYMFLKRKLFYNRVENIGRKVFFLETHPSLFAGLMLLGVLFPFTHYYYEWSDFTKLMIIVDFTNEYLQILSIVILEHILIALYFIIQLILSGKPEWIRLKEEEIGLKVEKDKIEYGEDKVREFKDLVAQSVINVSKNNEKIIDKLTQYSKKIDNKWQDNQQDRDKEIEEYKAKNFALIEVIREYSFDPKNLEVRMRRLAFSFIENLLVSMRYEKVQHFIKRTVCEENPQELSAYYSFKSSLCLTAADEFISLKEYKEFAIRMNIVEHERITLPPEAIEVAEGEIPLVDFLMIKRDPDYTAKFDLYTKKNKLTTLIKEYTEKKGSESIAKKRSEMSFWIKLERCDAILEDIQDCFDVLRDLYDKFIGFNKTAEETEDNPNLFLNIETIAESKEFRPRLELIGSKYRVEDLLMLNRIYFYCLRISNDDFIFSDFHRNAKLIYSNQLERQVLMMLNYADEEDTMEVDRATLQRLFTLSSVRDLLGRRSVETILDRLFQGANKMRKAELYELAIQDQDFRDIASVFFK